ncbi:MAG: hypothetical protein IJJ77_08540 [Paludibacteraceae bacterium]|nr:hypothetical protein [Paludibacteraceae bacterium]
MKLKNKFIAASFALPMALGSMLVSCEDSCNNCNCESYTLTSVCDADSVNTPLRELYSEETVVIRGTGLSMTREVYLQGEDGTLYAVALNPSLISDNTIIITMDSEANLKTTTKLVLVSNGGCKLEYAISKPVPAPSMTTFYSEFVPDGDTCRVLGKALISDTAANDILSVWFQKDGGNPVYVTNFKTAHDNTELLFPVPAGVENCSYLYLKNSHGETKSSVMFRDTRNIFLDFDKQIASDWRGSMTLDNTGWNMEALGTRADDYVDMFNNVLGGKFPKGCNGLYNAITLATSSTDFSTNSAILLAPYLQGETKSDTSLLGQFRNEDISNLCLKFEVYVPEKLKFASYFYIVFANYGAEDEEMCHQHYGSFAKCEPGHLRGLTSNGTNNRAIGSFVYDESSATLECLQNQIGVPAAWFHPGAFEGLNEDEGSGTIVITDPNSFYTKHGWMTVAIPLSSDYFRFSPKDKDIVTTNNYKTCHTLDVNDFYTMFVHTNNEECQKALKTPYGPVCFVGFDNFRIVPDDGAGVRFTKYNGATPGSKYPY